MKRYYFDAANSDDFEYYYWTGSQLMDDDVVIIDANSDCDVTDCEYMGAWSHSDPDWCISVWRKPTTKQISTLDKHTVLEHIPFIQGD